MERGIMKNETKIYDILALLEKTFKVLSEDEAIVIAKRFGLLGREYTLEEIAKEFGITRERVRQKQEKGLYKLDISYEAITRNEV